MSTLSITRVKTATPAYTEVYNLREEILRKPIGLSLKNEDLSRDFIDVIFAGTIGGKVIACLMLHHIDEAQLQLRQMAVYPNWQGHGVGSEMVHAAEGYAITNGYKKMILHARKEATGFYHALGYVVVGGEFTEVGIPHFVMEKLLV